MSKDLLSRLRAARSPEERAWLVTLDLLDSLPADLQAAAWAAAVPHWFDTDILAALLDRPPSETETLYAELQKLPFVESFEARAGHNVHQVTRTAMLDHLWHEQHDKYVALSARAATYFAGRDESEWQIERAYHLLISDPDRGADTLWNLGADWNNSFQYTLVFALAQAGLEQAEAGRSQGRGRGWTYFRLGQVESQSYRHPQATAAFREALQSVDGDRQLEANCIQSLGDVHVRLSELAEARARYEEALPIYRAIGDKLGEANCDFGLGDVAKGEEDWLQAEQFFQAALSVYREIGMPFNIGLALQRLGVVAEGRGDQTEAVRFYREALQIFEAIGVKMAEFVREALQRVGTELE